jgi:multicomponent Na+:H+ antiporter subunit E
VILFLAAAWVALTGDLSPWGIGFGVALGAGCQRIAAPLGAGAGFRRVRPGRLAGLVVYFLWEVVVANVRVAAAVLGPRRRLRPAIVAVPLVVDRDAEVVLLANLVTLTPGTLSVDLLGNPTVLYVHAMSTAGPEALRREIKDGFERRILEAFR